MFNQDYPLLTVLFRFLEPEENLKCNEYSSEVVIFFLSLLPSLLSSYFLYFLSLCSLFSAVPILFVLSPLSRRATAAVCLGELTEGEGVGRAHELRPVVVHVTHPAHVAHTRGSVVSWCYHNPSYTLFIL
jgi:hypothetical protein